MVVLHHRRIVRVLLLLSGLGLVSAMVWGSHGWWRAPTGVELAPTEEEAPPESAPSMVWLTAEKIAAGGVRAAPIRLQELAEVITVPGQVRYDASRHVELRAPVECIVQDVLVAPGQWVAAGDRLVALSSPEVGRLRGQIQVAAAELRLARMQLEWQQQVADNLQDFLVLLDQDVPLAQAEKQFADRLLGDHRAQLVAAYSRYALALQAAGRAAELSATGLLAGQTRAQRESDQEIAAAHWRTVREQSLSRSQWDLVEAQAASESAEQAWRVARDQLQALLGPHASASEGDGENRYCLHAPFEGRIEQLAAVQMLRFQPSEEMLTLADTRTMWVAAQVHSRDWAALQAQVGQHFQVTVPGLTGRPFVARMMFVDATVSPTTGAVPLLAQLPNDDQTLRAGMFVWVQLPLTPPRSVLAVPVAAVQRRAAETFVFVQREAGAYQRLEVALGVETPDWIEVRSGLAEGDLVVDHGAFVLTSELFLKEE